MDVTIIDEKELHDIDPNVKTFKHALYSPTTATVDPMEISQTIKYELIQKGVEFRFNEAYVERVDGDKIKTSKKNLLYADKLINTAGLYADKIAKDFGYSKDYTIIPFKGIYLKYQGKEKPVTTNVYPVPNLKNPFLGVHFTVTVDGTVKIGPTSMPAFWRENYNGFDNFKPSETLNILTWEARLFFSDAFGFRALAFDEIKKYNRGYFTSLGKSMVKKMDVKGFNQWGTPGIRAQLLSVHTRELVMDFVVEGDKESTHVLNAVSPAFTCSQPFSKWLIDNYVI